MSYHVIDRRDSQKGKSSGNRQRFLRRVKQQVKEAAKEIIRDGDIKDLADGKKGKKINIPARDLKEYQITHGSGGKRDVVHPGNKEFDEGDRFSRPPKGAGGSGEGDASNSGEGSDEFSFELTQEEFLDMFFEDLELPNLTKEALKSVDTFQYNRAGFVNEGTPARLNIERSMRKAKGRRTALRGPKKKKLKELEAELEQLNASIETLEASGQDATIEKDRRTAVEEKIKKLKRKIKAVPFIDDMDLQYNFWKKTPQPTTQAVMFCIMDVSGSMSSWHKEMAKRFYLLLYLFLLRTYERVDIVYIRHHTIAKEVDYEEFFYSRETGGTVVSPALDLVMKIINERYDPASWNIYGCQASDGDNWHDDNIAVEDLLLKSILPIMQYFAYVEIKQNENRPSGLWDMYEKIRTTHENFDSTVMTDINEIYPVFRKLFERDKGSATK